MYQKYKQKFEAWFEGNRFGVGLALSLFIVLAGTVLMMQGANAQKDSGIITSKALDQENNTTINQETKEDIKTQEVVFDIEGAVADPGVYRLPVGSVLVDAINKAGGFSIEADKDRIAKELNQASIIGNNSKIYIFKNTDKEASMVSVGSAPTGASSGGASQTVGAKINVNKATLAELDTLPGIGPAIGQRIIDWRDANGGYEVVEDLKKVKGIGDSLFDKMKELVVVE